jgi:FAD/FMN-containing dehydrogenase
LSAASFAAADRAPLAPFREAFEGEVVMPDDAEYDAARAVWNGMIDRRPALVVRPTGAADVVRALRFGRQEDLPIAVRSGGHSLPGHSTCDGGIVIDLRRMRGVTVDPVRRIARVNGGALLGELDDAAQAHGLACNVGTVSHTGVAGLTLGGGMGRLQRALGLTIDALRAVEVVTADGRQVRASDDERADLFWGMRGAGANFGIVTAFEFALWPVGPVITRGMLTYPGERARDVVAAFCDLLSEAPDELMASLIVARASAERGLPASVAGAPVVTVSITYVGRDATRDLAGFRALGRPTAGEMIQQTHLASQHANDAGLSWGHRVYTKSGFLGAIPDALVDAMIAHVADAPGDDVFSIWAQGGTLGRIPDDATAFTGRQAPFWIGAETLWDDPALDDAHVGWSRAAIALTEPYRDQGGYVNDVTDQGDEMTVRALYGDAKYRRLAELKRTWDPDNVFRLNQNIQPSSEGH